MSRSSLAIPTIIALRRESERGFRQGRASNVCAPDPVPARSILLAPSFSANGGGSPPTRSPRSPGPPRRCPPSRCIPFALGLLFLFDPSNDISFCDDIEWHRPLQKSVSVKGGNKRPRVPLGDVTQRPFLCILPVVISFSLSRSRILGLAPPASLPLLGFPSLLLPPPLPHLLPPAPLTTLFTHLPASGPQPYIPSFVL